MDNNMSIVSRGVEHRCIWQEWNVTGRDSDGEDSKANKTYSALHPHCQNTAIDASGSFLFLEPIDK